MRAPKVRFVTVAQNFLRDARILRLDAAEALRRGRCRYASPLDAAIEAGRAAGASWFVVDKSLNRQIAEEQRKIRNLMYAYERRCVGRERMV